MTAATITATLLTGGCNAPGAKPVGDTAKPNFGPPMQDTRTETVIHQMELDYIAAKNSRPTQQHIAEAEKRKKEQQQAEAVKQAEAKQQEATKQQTKE
jgi:hypothetical protein